MKKFSWDHPPQCPCQQIRELHPDLTTTSIEGIDHIASEARLLTVSRRLQFWLSCSAQTQVYPGFEEYCRISWHAVDQWLQHYKIGGIQYLRWREFIAKQWTLHQKSAVVPVSMADISIYVHLWMNWSFKDEITLLLTYMSTALFCIIMFSDLLLVIPKYTPRET